MVRTSVPQKEMPHRIRELEASLRECDHLKQAHSLQLQRVARQVAQENERLRQLVCSLEQQKATPVELSDKPLSIPAARQIHPTGGQSMHRDIPQHLLPVSETSKITTSAHTPVTLTEQQPSQSACACAGNRRPQCDLETPSEDVPPPKIAGQTACDERSEKVDDAQSCQKALELVDSLGTHRETDEIRELLGCGEECCADLARCQIENHLLMAVLDDAI